MTNQGLSSCADNTIQAISAAEISGLMTDEYVLAFIGNHQKYVSALGKHVINENNKALTNAYDEVSKLLSTFRKATDLLLLSRNATEVALGERVKSHLGSLDRSWNRTKKREQRSYLTNLIDEFSRPEYATDMAATPLAVIFDQIKDGAEVYGTALKNSIDRNEEIRATDSATALREPLMESYNACYYHIQAMAHVSKDAAWARLLASIDALLENERMKLKARQSTTPNATEPAKSPLTIAANNGAAPDSQAV